ncbi:hypothetical protein NMY22_g8399 [Coprinellus aureogranulatus]|nr:hypothetical protein NMY22_g8399 [Coprinellus aureogranulatus]
MRYLPPTQARLMTPLERFLLLTDPYLVSYFLHFLDVPDLILLGKVSGKIRRWFNSFTHKMWNFMEFVRLYFHMPHAFLSLCDEKEVLMFGEAVLRFMLRSRTSKCPLDICTNLNRFEDVTNILRREGYHSRSPNVPAEGMEARDRVGDLVRRTYRIDSMTWLATADRASESEDLEAFVSSWARGPIGAQRVINLHLVRCEPYRHVLSRYITPMTCFMTGMEAVCVFASSIFRHKKAIVLDGKAYGEKNHPRRRLSIDGLHGPHVFDVVLGPPKSFSKVRQAETGVRSIGDKYCWILDRFQPDPTQLVPRKRGRTFEVVDFGMLHDDEGTYMRVGEPFVLSSQYFHRLRNYREDVHNPHELTAPGKSVGSVSVLILSTTKLRPEWAPIPVYAFNKGGKHVEVLDVEKYFPGGYHTVLLTRFPGSGNPLPWPYLLFLDNYKTEQPVNTAYDTTFQRTWLGNVIVAKYSKTNLKNKLSFAQVARYEAELLTAVVGEYLEYIWNRVFGPGAHSLRENPEPESDTAEEMDGLKT